MLAIRTTSFGLELPISDNNTLLFSDSCLELVVNQANSKLISNLQRVDRLLHAIELHCNYPTIQVTRNIDTWKVNRWGHCCISDSNDAFLVMGGYGMGIGSGHSSRKLMSITDHDINTINLSNSMCASINPFFWSYVNPSNSDSLMR